MASRRLWIDSRIRMTLAGGGTSNDQSLMTGVAAITTRMSQMTLLRTIVGFDIAYSVHDSGEGSQLVSVGMGVASQEAFAVGSFSDSDVDTDFPTRGWIWRAVYRIWGFAADQSTIFTRRVDLDLRSMRKLENGEAFFNAHNADEEGVSSPVFISGLIRQLWQVS